MPESGLYEEVVLIDGQPIGYCRYGRGPNNVLAICGAVGCYAKDWPEENLRLFDPELVTIIAFDPPGYGTSCPPERKQELRRCEKDSVFGIKLMQMLSLAPFTVVGWSEGARTAMNIAAKGADKVTRAVLLAAMTRVDAKGASIFKRLRNIDDWDGAEKEAYLRHCSEPYFRKQWADNCDLVNDAYIMLGGRFPCEEDAASKIKCPTLLLHGSQDKLAAHPKYIVAAIKNARLEEHMQGGHDFHKKYPRWVCQKIQAFIKEDMKRVQA